MPDMLLVLTFIAIVLTLSALASGLLERVPLSFPMRFLGLGFLCGEHERGMITMGLRNGYNAQQKDPGDCQTRGGCFLHDARLICRGIARR